MPKPDYQYPLLSPMEKGTKEEIEERRAALKMHFETDDWEEIALGLARNHLSGFKLRNPAKGPKATKTQQHLDIKEGMDLYLGKTLLRWHPITRKPLGMDLDNAAKQVAFEVCGNKRPNSVKLVKSVYKMLRRKDEKTVRSLDRMKMKWIENMREGAEANMTEE